ncbi:Subtilisin NAT [Paramyrothecium foliicola]|nr:Subtilisin NAT [Paramyrothecium foliicola]
MAPSPRPVREFARILYSIFLDHGRDALCFCSPRAVVLRRSVPGATEVITIPTPGQGFNTLKSNRSTLAFSMRAGLTFPILAFAALAVAQVVQEQDEPDLDQVEELEDLQIKSFIVEFAQNTGSKLKRDNLLSAEDGVTVVKTFDSDVFVGASVEVDNADAIDAVRTLPDVVAVWPNYPLKLLAPVARQVAVGEDAAEQYAVHWATGIDELHKQGYYGEGVKVGIVDTGIWYNHTALGSGYGEGFKVAGGWDFVGNGPWVAGTAKRPDADPIDEQYHGTHVAGIVAGDSTVSNWTGVAPKATLYAYKVFGSNDGTDTATLIESFLRAYDEGMDIITASVGGRGGFETNPWAVVASRLVDRGVVVTIAAGNSGNGGPYYASSGSSGDGVVCVASAKLQAATKQIAPSYFTSWGGLYDLTVKPDITGPGTDIFSTLPGGSGNEYGLLSGTSMATPYLAGVAALWISRYGGRGVHGPGFARELAMRIIASGNPLPWLNPDQSVNTDFRAPSHQVGTGLVDARKVLRATNSLAYQKFALNDTVYFEPNHEIVLTNSGNGSVKYEFESESWAGFDMMLDFIPSQATETPRLRARSDMQPSKFDTAVVLPEPIELAPGQSKAVQFTFSRPNGLNETKMPAYSGRVLVKASNGDELSVPYQGIAFDMREQFSQAMFAGTYPWLRSTPAYSNKTTFTFDLSTTAQDFPRIYWKLNWGTKELRFDIYGPDFDASRDWEYPPTVNSNHYLGSAAPWVQASALTFNPAVHNRENTYPMPQIDVGRNALTTGGFTGSLFWLGKFTNGSYIQPGKYT